MRSKSLYYCALTFFILVGHAPIQPAWGDEPCHPIVASAPVSRSSLLNFQKITDPILGLFPVPGSSQNLYVKTEPDGIQASVFVDCEIDKTPTKCALDTGSAFTVDSGAVDFLKDKRVIGQTNSAGVDGVAISCDRLSIDHLKVLGKQTSVTEITRCKGFPLELSPNIGFDIFLGEKFVFDFPNQKMTWVNQNPHPATQEKLGGASYAGWRTMSARLGKQPIKVLFDTGSHLSIVDERYVAQHPNYFQLLQETDVTDASGVIKKQKIYASVSLKMGHHTFDDNSNVFVAVDFTKFLGKSLGPDVPIVLGMNHIKQFSWFFDLKNNLWSLSK